MFNRKEYEGMNVDGHVYYAAEIIDNLYLSSVGPATSNNFVTKIGIESILTLLANNELNTSDQQFLSDSNRFTWKWIKIKDGFNPIDNETDNLQNTLNECADFINTQLLNNKKTIVHCAAGMSRSPTMILAYLIKYKSMKLNKAIKLMDNKRPCIGPNRYYKEQLRIFEKEYCGDASDKQQCSIL